MADFHFILNLVIIGLVEGLTEFLPISSTGHIILAERLLGFDFDTGKFLEIAVQLASILALIIYFRKDITRLLLSLFSEKNTQYFAFTIILAMLPAILAGILWHDVIVTRCYNPTTVAYALIVGGIIMLAVDLMPIKERYNNFEHLPGWLAVWTGCCQAFAMIPGVSRSGATIVGALACGTSRQTAAKFSFFLAIPTMFSASSYSLYKNYHMLQPEHLSATLIASIASFFSALLAIRVFFKVISRYGLSIFAFYRIVLGGLILFSPLA